MDDNKKHMNGVKTVEPLSGNGPPSTVLQSQEIDSTPRKDALAAKPQIRVSTRLGQLDRDPNRQRPLCPSRPSFCSESSNSSASCGKRNWPGTTRGGVPGFFRSSTDAEALHNLQTWPHGTTPHSIEDLQSERSYLLDSLRRQDERAMRLLISYAALEDRLPFVTTARECRKIRKELKLLGIKMIESSNQERLALARLDELYMEIRTHDRLRQVQSWRSTLQALASTQLSMPHCLATPESPAAPSSVANTLSSVLSPLSPTFVPGSERSQPIFWAQQGADGGKTPEEVENDAKPSKPSKPSPKEPRRSPRPRSRSVC